MSLKSVKTKINMEAITENTNGVSKKQKVIDLISYAVLALYDVPFLYFFGWIFNLSKSYCEGFGDALGESCIPPQYNIFLYYSLILFIVILGTYWIAIQGKTAKYRHLFWWVNFVISPLSASLCLYLLQSGTVWIFYEHTLNFHNYLFSL